MDRIRLHREFLKKALFNAPKRQDLVQTITVEGRKVTVVEDGPNGFTHWGQTMDNPIAFARKLWETEKYKEYKLIVK